MKKTPSKVRVDASTVCQLKCVTCPTVHEVSPVVGRGFVSFVDFKKLLDENRQIKEIELSSFGEILLNPDLVPIVEYAYNKGVRLRADNGVNFNTVKPGLLEALAKFRFHSILCSIDGASEETYRQYRIRGSFSNVINNIKELQDIKRRLGTEYPLLTWQFVIFGHNEHEIENARKMAEKLGMKFVVKLNWDEVFSPIRDPEHVKRTTGLSITSRADAQKKSKRGYMNQTCHQLWDEPQINWDGKLLGCCWNFWGEFGPNVFESSLYQALRSEKMITAKKMLLGKAQPREGIPCATCENYLAMVDSGKYLKRGVLFRMKKSAVKLLKTVLRK